MTTHYRQFNINIFDSDPFVIRSELQTSYSNVEQYDNYSFIAEPAYYCTQKYIIYFYYYKHLMVNPECRPEDYIYGPEDYIYRLARNTCKTSTLLGVVPMCRI